VSPSKKKQGNGLGFAPDTMKTRCSWRFTKREMTLKRTRSTVCCEKRGKKGGKAIDSRDSNSQKRKKNRPKEPVSSGVVPHGEQEGDTAGGVRAYASKTLSS